MDGGREMNETEPRWEAPLAQVQELSELKRRYAVYDDGTLLRWMNAVTGSHREAMAQLLRERGRL